MPVAGGNITQAQRDLMNIWSEDQVSGAEVIKDFTETMDDNIMVEIKAGTKSHGYSHYNFHFKSHEGPEVLINVATISQNNNYFKPILK